MSCGGDARDAKPGQEQETLEDRPGVDTERQDVLSGVHPP